MAEVSKLIEKQIAMWSIKDRLEEFEPRPGRCIHAGISYGPCLLMSRECGSGGGLVAHKVGERLGWQVFDREIVDEIAHAAHVRQHLVQSVDEHARSYWEQTCTDILSETSPEGDMASEKYLTYLRQVVLSLGHHGEVVMVGRGAQYLLPPACGLRVRMVAPLEVRIKRLAESEKLSVADARHKVRKLDADRANFIRKYFKSDANSPLNCDLVINTGDVTTDHAVEIVLAALAAKLGVRPVK